MINIDEIGRNVKEQFGEEKIIVGIKNKEIKIKFLKSYIWIIPLIITLGIILNIGMINIIFTEAEKNIVLIIFCITLLSSMILYFYESCKIYFEDDYLILENKLRMKKYYDIKRFPRIYIRQHSYDGYSNLSESYKTRMTYKLYLEQNNDLLKLNIKTCGVENIQKLIENFQMKNREECTQEEWNFSVNNKELKMFEYMKFLNTRGEIIGIKDKDKNMEISKKQNLPIYILTIILILVIYIELWMLKEELYVLSIFVLLGIIINIGALITKNNDNKIKISYKDNIMKINKYLLRYEEKKIRINIKAMQTPYAKEKYEYSLQIKGEKKDYIIFLGNANEIEVGQFIDNINFKETND